MYQTHLINVHHSMNQDYLSHKKFDRRPWLHVQIYISYTQNNLTGLIYFLLSVEHHVQNLKRQAN